MQQPTLLMQLLLALSNLYIVAAAVVVVIGIRLLWVRRRQRADKVAGVPQKRKDFTLETIDTVLIALILVFGLVRPFLLETFFIPSGSMEPTLLGPYNPAAGDELNQGVWLKETGKRAGDKLIANKFIYHFRQPQRGDVVVFQPPVEAIVGNNLDLMFRAWLETNPRELTSAELLEVVEAFAHSQRSVLSGDAVLPQFRQVPRDVQVDWLLAVLPPQPSRPDDFIKRVIGQPGDRVQVREGTVSIIPANSTHALPDPDPVTVQTETKTYEAPGPRPRPDDSTVEAVMIDGRLQQVRVAFGPLFIDWLNRWYGYTYLYPRLRDLAPHDRLPEGVVEFVVPTDAVLVMGDNRGNSFDSRYWGVVPIKNVKARAVSTFWPLTRLKLL